MAATEMVRSCARTSAYRVVGAPERRLAKTPLKRHLGRRGEGGRAAGSALQRPPHPPFYADNSTLSLLPTALAARSSVDSVTEGFAGSSSRSTAGLLVLSLIHIWSCRRHAST